LTGLFALLQFPATDRRAHPKGKTGETLNFLNDYPASALKIGHNDPSVS
jgi:hypothetical protein